MKRVVLQSKPSPRHGDGAEIVLCSISDANCDFVTWIRDRNGNDYYGHYHRCLVDAANDFEQRR